MNHLLRHADGRRLAVLVNEFGALPIDEELIDAREEDMISIAGGCVCCSYGNDLVRALMRLQELKPAPDHVLLEASGVAIPSAIAASVSLLQGFSMDGILILANAETIRAQASDNYVGDTTMRQLSDSDLLVLNKVDLVDEATRHSTEAWLSGQFGGVEVVPTTQGALPLDVVLAGMQPGSRNMQIAPADQAHPFETRSLELTKPTDATRLAKALADPELALIRAKGFVRDHAGKVQAIQTVGRRWDVQDAPDSQPSGLVVIGLRGKFDLAAIESAIGEAQNKEVPCPQAD